MKDLATPNLIERLSALADQTRLRLLLVLEAEELGVAELCEVLQLPQSTVSRHLKVLGEQGWLVMRRAGTSHLHRLLVDELTEPARQMWVIVRAEAASTATAEQDALRLDEMLVRRGNRAEAFLADAASRWTEVRDELFGSGFQAAALAALLPASATVADLGCGAGLTSRDLARRARRVIAVDASEAMLDAARATTRSCPNVEIRPGALTALPMRDGECDAALLLVALTYLAEPELALREAGRVLAPGGRLVVVDLLPHDRDDFRRELGHAQRGLEPTRVEAALCAAGFDEIVLDPLPPEPKARGPALFLASATRVNS
jgi:ArsR family transcriptional regulator